METDFRFSKDHIGAELLPILTSGLYRHTMDTLREYIQNAIDAGSKSIDISIDPDILAIRDNGRGMTFSEAKNAIRLGMSEKNPLDNVGFRGIGIYSAFNLCNTLTVYTRSVDDPHGYVLRFEFSQMRERLLFEAERRKQGLAPELYLESLLQESVKVYLDDSPTIETHGTLAILGGLLPETYDTLNNWDQVVRYLQNVVPLPFHPDFKFKAIIEERFTQESSRIVPLKLRIGNIQAELYRPYTDAMFNLRGKYPPKFIDVHYRSERFGFAWVCINDVRRVLQDVNLRGLLIKKFEFSIADRHFLEPYFRRTVFNRRISGEIIIQNQNLVPNAARSDFEPNRTRQTFFQHVLPNLIKEISSWADEIQEGEKASEVLAEALKTLLEMSRTLPQVRRDRELLLKWNVELSQFATQFRAQGPHARRLRQLDPKGLARATALLDECQVAVKEELLAERKSRRSLEDRATRAARRETEDVSTEQAERLQSLPSTLVELFDSYALLSSAELQKAIRLLDEEVLQAQLSSDQYRSALAQLRDLMEESS